MTSLTLDVLAKSPAQFPTDLASEKGLDEQDVAAAETAANLLIEIYMQFNSIRALNWAAHIEAAIRLSSAVQATFAAFDRYNPKDFRDGEWVVANGLSVLVKCSMLEIDESTEEDLFIPTKRFALLFH